jgi:DNA primase
LDPSDLRQQRGDSAISELVASAKPLFEFVMRHRISAFDLRDVDSRIAAARAALPVLLELADAGTRSAYIRQLSEWLNLSETELSSLLARLTADKGAPAAQPQWSTEAPHQPQDDSIAAEWRDPREDAAERRLLEVLIQRPESATRLELQKLSAAGLTTKKFQLILEALSRDFSSPDPDIANQLSQQLPAAASGLLRELLLSPLPVLSDADAGRYCRGVIQMALRRALEREKTELLSTLKRTPEAETDKLAAIQRELVSLDGELAKLK